jgi:uncharacterized membrane protein YgcG
MATPLGLPISEKLSKNNLQLWKLQVLPAIRGAQLEEHLASTAIPPPKEIVVKQGGTETKEVNPEFTRWMALDQQVLSYLLSTMTRDVMLQVATATTAAELWAAVEEIFSSQSRARAMNTRIALATLKKGNMSANDYVAKMKALADEMAGAGKPISDDELVGYILMGLDEEYNPLVSAIITRVEPIGYGDLLAQILSFESRLNMSRGENSSQSSANIASRGRGGFSPKNRGGGRGSSGGRGRGNGGRGGRNSNSKPRFNGKCQVCFKEGHSAAQCWHRFDEDFVPDEKNVNAATYAYGVDTNWYTDTGATDHITSNLEKLSIHDKYNGGDKIRTASGTGMNIDHIGHATIKTPSRDLYLRNILHAPQATKNLVSVHRLAADNHAFLEFHPNFFLVKDQETKKTLLEGRCRGGLYPLPDLNKEALSAIRPSFSRWHSRLGHPSFPIVHKVVSENNLPCAREATVGSVCDACQQAKSHQLPYPKSSSVSKFPLDLIFFGCVGTRS